MATKKFLEMILPNSCFILFFYVTLLFCTNIDFEMIQEFSITNYRSYKDKQTFSFEATEDTLDLEGQTVLVGKQIKDGKEEDVRLLKFAVVYGANASGKTNLLKFFESLHNLWNGKTVQESGLCDPYKLQGETDLYGSCKFDLIFWVDGIQWKYQLSVTENQINKEKLSIENKPCLNDSEKNFIDYFRFDFVRGKQDPIYKSLVYTNYLSDSELPADDKNDTYTKLLNFLSDSIQGYNYLPELMLDDKIRNSLLKSIVYYKDKILYFLKKYDFNITDIIDNSSVTKKKIPELYTLHKYIDTETNEEKSDWLPLMQSDSQGTYSVMILLFLLAFRRGSGFSFKCFDELESSLHPEIVEHLIDEFMHNPIYANSQLLITTHDTSLLRTTGDLLRPDEIWFTDKGEDGATSLYSLADFKDLEEVRDFQGAYLHGVFGAVPKI